MTKLEQIREFLVQTYPNALRHNVILDKEEWQDENEQWHAFSTRDINSIACACNQAFQKNITDRDVYCVLKSDLLPNVHPVRDWLQHLKPYEPQKFDWIDYLATQVTVEDDQNLWKECFHKWFVAMVASWMFDEVVNQQVLVLIGPQGIYKTTWLERLLPPQLRQYGMSMPSVRELNKDDRLRIAEAALINIDEIDALSDRELNVLKSVITASDVNERAAYARTKERRLRLASFCACGNKDQFLTDSTGNRRWLPFHVQSIQNPFLNPIQPYDRYYAQALWEIEHGYEYWFDKDAITRMETQTESFHKEACEEQLLKVFYEPVDISYNGAVLRTAAEISAKLTFQGNIKHPMSLTNLGKVLQKEGFQQKRCTGGVRKYIVHELSNNAAEKEYEINQLRNEI